MKSNVQLFCDPETPFLGTYPRRVGAYVNKMTCIITIKTNLFIIV